MKMVRDMHMILGDFYLPSTQVFVDSPVMYCGSALSKMMKLLHTKRNRLPVMRISGVS